MQRVRGKTIAFTEKLWEQPGAIIEKLFSISGRPLVLADFQVEIVKSIIFPSSRRVIICCATQAGKSMSVAVGILLSAILYDGERIVIVSHSLKQSKIVYDYVINFLAGNAYFREFIDYEAGSVERIRKELSRERMTFKNGSSIKSLSAGGSGKGEQLLGHSADLLIIDESGSIEDEIYNTKLLRMLGAKTDVNKQLVEVGTPHVKNHFYNSWISSSYKKIKINWETAVKEGRLDEKFILEQRDNMSAIEFQMWYEAEFPEESEDALIKWQWVEEAREREFDFEGKGKVIAGLDVAEMGPDFTVLTVVELVDNKYKVLGIHSWGKKDTMVTVGKVRLLLDNYKVENVAVDTIGVGRGVYDRLVELGYHCTAIKVGMSPTKSKNKERFANLKAEYYWKLRDLFEQGMLDIPASNHLLRELNLMEYEFTSTRKVRIVDPSKSPDFADSLMLSTNAVGNMLFDFV